MGSQEDDVLEIEKVGDVIWVWMGAGIRRGDFWTAEEGMGRLSVAKSLADGCIWASLL